MLRKYLAPEELLEKLIQTFKEEFKEDLRLEGLSEMIDGMLLERYNHYVLTVLENCSQTDLQKMKSLIQTKLPSPESGKRKKTIFN